MPDIEQAEYEPSHGEKELIAKGVATSAYTLKRLSKEAEIVGPEIDLEPSKALYLLVQLYAGMTD